MHEQHERTGWPHAIVGSADLFAPDAIDTVEAAAGRLAAACAASACSCTGTTPSRRIRFASGPDRASDRTFNENLAKLPGLGLVFELQVFPNQLASALRAGRRRTPT